MRSPLKGLAIGLLPFAIIACDKVGHFPDQEEICSFDNAREIERAASAAVFPDPVITSISVNNTTLWQAGQNTPITLSAGDIVTIHGAGLGNGVDVDFSKIMIGNTRILETDLVMYEQKLDIIAQVNFEIPQLHSTWDKNVLSWAPDQIEFRVPDHASDGDLIIQVQKRTGYLESLIRTGEPHNVVDAQTSRITDPDFQHNCDVVSTLSEAKSTPPISVVVNNPHLNDLIDLGRAVFWSYDYNIGTAHAVRDLDWEKIFNYESTDPITGLIADPVLLFGAVPTVPGQVPNEALDDVYFDPYPQQNPIPGFLTLQPQLTKGLTRNTGWTGYRYAESNHPFAGKGEWIGFNCASCHGYQITYENAPGTTVTKVIPGLPNPTWSMKWALLDKFEGIRTNEKGPVWTDGTSRSIDKTMLIYHMPQGTGEHNIVRAVGEGSHTDNDYQFSPIAIPNVTNYMAIRRSLSHTESYVGFEGSYIHAEEPDGAMGSMDKESLEALTAYMTILDQDDDDLRNAGLYRWLSQNDQLTAQAGSTPSEGEFVQAGWQNYPGIVAEVNKGKAVFDRDCANCHADGLGSHTNEKMIRLDEVGRFFAPTIYQKETQSIRATFLRDLYWVQHRGLLSDGHVRNLEDLVDPDRCSSGTDLYNAYYTLHPPLNTPKGGPDHPDPYPAYQNKGDVFRVPKADSTFANDTGDRQNRFTERHKYFVEVPWDEDFYYWDYQKMRSEYGPGELGTPAPIGMPDAPHPWCTQADDIATLTQYLLTL
ncbi:MAG: IPT/TIG domain-containing protein [Pseudomonadales bacterium]|nr:IPT/TIG domain-containing protein [Pseudomonadales bacterium]